MLREISVNTSGVVSLAIFCPPSSFLFWMLVCVCDSVSGYLWSLQGNTSSHRIYRNELPEAPRWQTGSNFALGLSLDSYPGPCLSPSLHLSLSPILSIILLSFVNFFSVCVSVLCYSVLWKTARKHENDICLLQVPLHSYITFPSIYHSRWS